MFKGKLIELPQLQRPPLIYETTLPFNDYLFIPPSPPLHSLFARKSYQKQGNMKYYSNFLKKKKKKSEGESKESRATGGVKKN